MGRGRQRTGLSDLRFRRWQMNSKVERAAALLRRIRAMADADLAKLIEAEVGNDLTSFFLAYGRHLVKNSPDPDVAAVMLLMGYLVRIGEESLPSPLAAKC